MIPRPIYKFLVGFLAMPLFLGALFLWSNCGNRLKTYYLTLESGFLFETLTPLPAPIQKLSETLGLADADLPREFDVITVRCGNKNCYATPQDIAAKVPHRHTRIRTRPSKLYAILNDRVFSRHPYRWLKVSLAMSGLGWMALFICAAIRDKRRRDQLFGDGVQIAGRRAIPAAAFAGLRAKFFPKKNINIAVSEPTQEQAPLAYD